VPGQAVPKPEPDSPPPSKPPRDSLGASAGLSELDSLLEMLNTTQDKIDQGGAKEMHDVFSLPPPPPTCSLSPYLIPSFSSWVR
jgi:hypothetical protein